MEFCDSQCPPSAVAHSSSHEIVSYRIVTMYIGVVQFLLVELVFFSTSDRTALEKLISEYFSARLATSARAASSVAQAVVADAQNLNRVSPGDQ